MIVHTRAEHLRAVREQIEKMPGAEIHGESESGKLVVVLETDEQSQITQTIDAINDLDQVLNTSLVYHQIEPIQEE